MTRNTDAMSGTQRPCCKGQADEQLQSECLSGHKILAQKPRQVGRPNKIYRGSNSDDRQLLQESEKQAEVEAGRGARDDMLRKGKWSEATREDFLQEAS